MVDRITRLMKNLWVLAVFLCVYLTSTPASSSEPGPAFFNATDDVILIDVSYGQGSGLRGDLAPGQVERWPFAWQVQTIKVQLKNGDSLKLSEADGMHLRKKLAQPKTQVWVIDGSRICVVASRRFKATKGFRCPGHYK
jgi:hypothetical protein